MVLKPASYTRLTALLFAEICTEAGLPPGVFNVVTGTGSFGSLLATHPLVDKVGFTGSTEVRYEVWVQGLILCLGLEIKYCGLSTETSTTCRSGFRVA